MLEESSVYQDIFQKGERRGLQKGEQRGLQKGEQRGVVKGERKLALLLLEERFGKLSPKIRKQMEHLPAEQLEGLGKALLGFQSKQDLTNWLRQHAPAH